MRPDVTNLESYCVVLEAIAADFAEGSDERGAILAGTQALHYVRHAGDARQVSGLGRFLDAAADRAPGFERQAGGHRRSADALLDDTLREVEQLMEKLRQRRT